MSQYCCVFRCSVRPLAHPPTLRHLLNLVVPLRATRVLACKIRVPNLDLHPLTFVVVTSYKTTLRLSSSVPTCTTPLASVVLALRPRETRETGKN